MGQYHQLLTLELTGLTHDLAKHLVTYRFRRFDEPAPLARWTRLAQEMFQTFARAFARHFDQPQGRYRRDAGLHVIVGKSFFQGLDDPAAMIRPFHVHDIADDYAPQLSTAQSSRH